MSRPSRARLAYAACALATIAVGVLLFRGRPPLPAGLRDFLGDALWASMIVWWAGALAPAASLGRRSAAALAFCVVVELSQTVHAPWLDALRRTPAGHLVLGSDFDARDLAAYALGVGAAALLEYGVRRGRRRRW